MKTEAYIQAQAAAKAALDSRTLSHTENKQLLALLAYRDDYAARSKLNRAIKALSPSDNIPTIQSDAQKLVELAAKVIKTETVLNGYTKTMRANAKTIYAYNEARINSLLEDCAERSGSTRRTFTLTLNDSSASTESYKDFSDCYRGAYKGWAKLAAEHKINMSYFADIFCFKHKDIVAEIESLTGKTVIDITPAKGIVHLAWTSNGNLKNELVYFSVDKETELVATSAISTKDAKKIIEKASVSAWRKMLESACAA